MVEYRENPGRPVSGDQTPVPAELSTVEQTYILLRAMRQEQQAFLAESKNENSHERLSSVEKAVKWASPWRQIFAIIAVIVVSSIGAYTFLRDKAKEAVIETVNEATGGDNPKVEPSVKTVEEIRTNVESVNKGVNKLIKHQKLEQEIKEVEVELELHKQQHQDLVQEWAAKKAAGRSVGKKPTKSDGHIKLEADRRIYCYCR